MEREKIEIVIDCGKEEKAVSVEFVYNYVYDEFNKRMADLARIKEIMQEIAALELETSDAVARGGEIVVNREGDKQDRRAELKSIIALRIKNMAKVKELRKEARNINSFFLQKNMCELVMSILKDNSVTDEDLFSPKYWDRQVMPGEAWRFIALAVNKDAGKKKIAGI